MIKTIIQKDLGTPVFTAVMFAAGKTRKPPRCPLTDERVKIWYTHAMEYYSARKRNGCESVIERWMDLESVIQNKVTQKQKNKYRILTLAFQEALSAPSSISKISQ